jgi:hypothetical protein
MNAQYMKCTLAILKVILVFFLLACEKVDECVDDTEVNVNIDFKSFVNNIEKDTVINELTIIGNDTPYYNSINIQSVHLPLSQISDTSIYKFIVDIITDTVSFYSRREHYLVSYECGFTTRYTLDTVITREKLINSVSIIKSSVDSTDETNIIFYF